MVQLVPASHLHQAPSRHPPFPEERYAYTRALLPVWCHKGYAKKNKKAKVFNFYLMALSPKADLPRSGGVKKTL